MKSKVTEFFRTVKDLLLFPILGVDEGDESHYGSEMGKSSESAWLRNLKAENLKENRIPGKGEWTRLGARHDLRDQKSKARMYIATGLLITAAIVTAGVVLKNKLNSIRYERKRLAELNKKFELNTATELEVKEAVELSEKVLQICAMEDPNKTEVAVGELENEIVKEVA